MQLTRAESYQPSILSSLFTIGAKTTGGALVGGLVGDYLENQFILTTLPELIKSACENCQNITLENITLDHVVTSLSSIYSQSPLTVQLIGAGGAILFSFAVYQERNYRRQANVTKKIPEERLVEDKITKSYPKLNAKDVRDDLAGILSSHISETSYTMKSELEQFSQYICAEYSGSNEVINGVYKYAEKHGLDELTTGIDNLRAKRTA